MKIDPIEPIINKEFNRAIAIKIEAAVDDKYNMEGQRRELRSFLIIFTERIVFQRKKNRRWM
ncbi:hypothetical protein MJG50_09315 [Fredinandcohnia sp. SECRCQ15]|uniref:Uncharacterized protein n=2 Tax=Fredinandcohnia quinoae TaxID=2918902 RepID=A0AAW5E803_9BACI|nr:hypothetical protein [Fredinandcohnia sp. SECRCQ15]